jgi:UrcA family protein
MWLIKFFPMVLLGACTVAQASALPSDPIASVRYTDLALDSAADRAELRQRVGNAARAFCRIHGEDVTPLPLRNHPFYCLGRLRDSIVNEMPRYVRRAYALALREAGVRGARL